MKARRIILTVLACIFFVGWTFPFSLLDGIDAVRAWNCNTVQGATFCEGRLNESQTTYTVSLSVASSATVNAIANIYINGALSVSTGCLRPGQSRTLPQSIQWGSNNWTSDFSVGCN